MDSRPAGQRRVLAPRFPWSKRRLLALFIGLWFASGWLGSGSLEAADPPFLPGLPVPANAATNAPARGLLSWRYGQENLLLNGGFEAGLAHGWHPESNAAAWVVNPGNVPDLIPGSAASGDRFVSSLNLAVSGSCGLVQEVEIPARVAGVWLGWQDRIRSTTRPVFSPQDFRVEIRNRDDGVLAVPYLFPWEGAINQGWTARRIDLSSFRGQRVKIAFVVRTDRASRTQVDLDDVRLQTPPSDVTFELFLGLNATLEPSTRVGQTGGLSWALTDLAPRQPYFWRVDTLINGTRTAGQVWRFTTASNGIVDHFEIAPLASPQVAGSSATIRVTARDSLENVAPRLPAVPALRVLGQRRRASSVLITEVQTEPEDGVEFQNVGATPVSVAGWQVFVYTSASASTPRASFQFPAGTVVEPGRAFVLREGGTRPGRFPEFALGSAIGWGPGKAGNPVAVLLRDNQGRVADFMAAGDCKPTTILAPMAVPIEDWWGGPALLNTVTGLSYQRRGDTDRQGAADWVPGTSSLGQANPGLRFPFELGVGLVTASPGTLSGFKSGIATNLLWVQEPAVGAFAVVRDVEGAHGFSAPFDVLPFPRLRLSGPASVVEGAGTLPGALTIRIDQPRTTNVTITLQSDPAGQLGLAESIVLPAGTMETSAPLEVIDDGEADGTQVVTVSAEAPGFSSVPLQLRVVDNDPGTIRLAVPESIREGETAQARLTVEPRAPYPITIRLTASVPAALDVAVEAVLAPNAADAVVPLHAVDNRLLDGSRLVRLQAEVEGWPTAEAIVRVDDDERPVLQVSLPTEVAEGSSSAQNLGAVHLPGPTRSNVVVTLTSSDSERLPIPGSVTVLAGESGAMFWCNSPDDTQLNGSATVDVVATAAGWTDGHGTTRVRDNDPARFEFGSIASPQLVHRAFDVAIVGYAQDGEPVAGSSPVVTLEALGPDGPIPLSPEPVAHVQLIDGAWTGSVTLAAAGSPVQLVARAATATNASPAFHVLADPVVHRLESVCMDLAYDPGRGRLIASVAGAPGRIEVIDPQTGTIERSFALETIANQSNSWVRDGRLALAADGQHVYLVVQGATKVLQVDLDTGAIVRELAVNTATAHPLIADLLPVPGRTDQLVIALTDGGGWSLGLRVFREDGSVEDPFTLANLLGASDVPGQLFSCLLNNGPMLTHRLAFGPGGEVTREEFYGNRFQWSGGELRAFGGRLYYASGIVFDATTQGALGLYPVLGDVTRRIQPDPGEARLAFDLSGQRIFFLSRADLSSADQWLQPFDVATYTPLRSLAISGSTSAARRLVLCGTDTLAFNDAQRLYFVRSPLLLPTGNQPQVQFAQSVEPASPTVDVPARVTWRLTNQGPGRATDVIVTNELTATVLESVTVPRGAWSATETQWTWQIPELGPGESIEANLTVRFREGGQRPGRVLVQANEWLAPNGALIRNYSTYVQVEPRPDSLVLINLPHRAFTHDPSRHRLWVSLNPPADSRSNQVVAIDDRTFAPGPVLDELLDAGELSLSSDHQRLYVAYDSGSRIRGYDLAQGTATLDVELDPSDHRHQVASMSPVPGQPSALAVFARAFHPTIPIAWPSWIGVFDDGVRRPSAETAGEFSGGGALEFGASAADLFAVLDPPQDQLQRYTVDAAGTHLATSQRPEPYVAGLRTVRFQRGRLYGNNGTVMDPATGRTEQAIPGLEHDTLVAIDDANRRVVYLQGAADHATLRCFGLPLLHELGSQTLAVAGTDNTQLTLVDADRLLFRDAQGRFRVVRTPWLPSGPATDLALDLQPASHAGRVGETFDLTLTLANRGPQDARNVRLVAQLSDGLACTSAEAPGILATNTVNGRLEVQWSLDGLATAATRSFHTTVTLVSAGDRTVRAAIYADSPELNPTDNESACPITVTLGLRPGESGVLPVPAMDMVYDSVRDRLYLAGTPGQVTVVDPTIGRIEPPLAVSGTPLALALSPDTEFLYVGTTQFSGPRVHRFALASGRIDLDFPVPDEPLDLAVVPGDPESVVVLGVVGSLSSFRLYTHGSTPPGEVLHSWARDIEFDPRSGDLFGTPGAFPATLEVYRIFDHRVGLAANPTLAGCCASGDLAIANAWVFDSRGAIYDPAGDRVLSPGLDLGPTHGIAVRPDASRLFLLGNSNLLAVAVPSQVLLESKVVPPLLDAAVDGAKLVRWGTDGFAVSRQMGDLVLTRWPVVEAEPPVDLVLHVEPPAQPPVVSREFDLKLNVSNADPRAATGVVVQLTLPPQLEFVRAQLDGTTERHGSLVSCRWPPLAPGATAAATLTLRTEYSGPLALEVRTDSLNQDGLLGDNVTRVQIAVRHELSLEQAAVASLLIEDVVADPARACLYATTGSQDPTFPSRLLQYEPNTGSVERVVDAGNTPTRLALSDDGQFLYVAVRTNTVIRRFRLPAFELDAEFEPPPAPFDPAPKSVAWDFQVLPNRPRSLLLSSFPSNPGNYFTRLWVLDDGIPRPNSIEIVGGFGFAAPDLVVSQVPTNLANVRFAKIRIAPTGLALEQVSAQTLIGTSDERPRVMLDRILTLQNFVWDLPTLNYREYTDPVSQLEPDPAVGRYFTATWDSLKWILTARDPISLAAAATLNLAPRPGDQYFPRKLLRWGTDGLALLGPQRLYLVRTSLVPSGPPVDLSLGLGLASPGPIAGAPWTYQIRVNNPGPNAARNLHLNQTFASGILFITAVSDAASFAYTGGRLQGVITNLAANATTEIAVTVRSEQAQIAFTKAWLMSDAPDPDLANNLAELTHSVGFDLQANGRQDLIVRPVDLAYSRATRQLYASVRAYGPRARDAVLAIEPANGRVLRAVELPTASQLAVTDDGPKLYAGFDDGQTIRRFALPSLIPDLILPLRESLPDDYRVTRVSAAPGLPGTIAVTLASSTASSHHSVAIYDHAQRRPAMAPTEDEIVWAGFGATPDHLYALRSPTRQGGLVRYLVDASGLAGRVACDCSPSAWDLVYGQDRLFLRSGEIFDAASLGLQLMNWEESSSVAVTTDPVAPLAYYFHAYDTLAVHAYNFIAQSAHGQARYAPAPLGLNHPVRWGADGFAVINGEAITFLRSNIVPLRDGEDNDGDGLPDVWEALNGTNPNLDDADDDPDADGASNAGEYAAGTDPQDANSLLQLRGARLMGDQLQLELPTVAGRAYQLESRAELGAAGWSPWGSPIAGDGTVQQLQLPMPSGTRSGYYRVTVVR